MTMKTRLTIMAVLVAALALCGCGVTTGAGKIGGVINGQGGILGAVQTADEALAVRYGIPASVVKTVRATLGIPDARTLPKADQVLPAGWTWAYDLLDGEGKVVDPSLLHWGDTPRLRKADSLPASVFSAARPAGDSATLETVLSVIRAAGPVTTNDPIQALGARLP